MGWSCAAAAAAKLEAIDAEHKRLGSTCSNDILKDGVAIGFYEASRVEHADGAITGSVWRHVPGGCRRAGSFRVDPDGAIDRFPLLSRAVIKAVTK